MPDFEIREVPPVHVLLAPATCAHDQIGPTLPGCFRRAGAVMAAQGGQMAGPPLCRYTAWRETDCDLEGGMPTDRLLESTPDVLATTLGGKCVCGVHHGPYDQLNQTYMAAFAWLEAQGLQMRGGQWESYCTDPGAEPDPGKWRTEIYIPVE